MFLFFYTFFKSTGHFYFYFDPSKYQLHPIFFHQIPPSKLKIEALLQILKVTPDKKKNIKL